MVYIHTHHTIYTFTWHMRFTGSGTAGPDGKLKMCGERNIKSLADSAVQSTETTLY